MLWKRTNTRRIVNGAMEVNGAMNGALKVRSAACLRGENISLDRFFTSPTTKFGDDRRNISGDYRNPHPHPTYIPDEHTLCHR